MQKKSLTRFLFFASQYLYISYPISLHFRFQKSKQKTICQKLGMNKQYFKNEEHIFLTKSLFEMKIHLSYFVHDDICLENNIILIKINDCK